MKKELKSAFDSTINQKEREATDKQLKTLKEFQDKAQDYVSKVSMIMTLTKRKERPDLVSDLTFECRSLFVDLYKEMHENHDGIMLLEIKDYKFVIEVLLAYSFRLTNGLHQIEE